MKAFLALLLLTSTLAVAEPVKVARVVDGDTVVLTDGRKVRLLAVDTPEKWHSAKLDRDALRFGQSVAEVQRLGKAASAHTAALVRNQTLELTFDQEPRDRYGRTLGYLTRADGVLVNLQLIVDGYACALAKYPTRITGDTLRAQVAAETARRGLWAQGLQCDGVRSRYLR